MNAKQTFRPGRAARASVVVLLALLSAPVYVVHAEFLPVKTYITTEGLLRDEVFRMKQDTRGFLWFCTADGLSRFDGYAFTNYTTDDGLPHKIVFDFTSHRTLSPRKWKAGQR